MAKVELRVLLKERRKELGLSQLRAAEAIGISQSQLSRLENGKSKPPAALRGRLERWVSA